MAAFLLLLAPLLLLGTAAGQADMEIEECLWLWNVTEGNFSVVITPETYQANTTYLVTIRDDRNHSSSSGPFLLQALSPQNTSVGEWTDTDTGNCSSVLTAVLNSTESRAHWTSPNSNLSSVHIRVYLILPDNITELKTGMLSRGAETTPVPLSSTSAPSSSSSPNTSSAPNITSTPKTTSTPSSTPSSVSRAQGSSWLLAALLLLLTASLLS
ncbi:uncharacterized protein [Taeniopygia guttata]|uniref:uncharacterized protein n=1 Tax=Taeniopygia guttata TaxID=59729 RepID=UPI003BB96440